MRNISFCEYGPSGIRAAAHSGPDSMVLNFQDSNFFPEYSGQKYLTPQNSEIKLATFCKIDHLLKLLVIRTSYLRVLLAYYAYIKLLIL